MQTPIITAIVTTLASLPAAEPAAPPARQLAETSHIVLPRLDRSNPPPVAPFANTEALKKWAETSTAGGGAVESFRVAGRQVHVVRRRPHAEHASGDVAIFAPQHDETLALVCYKAPRPAMVRVRQAGDTLVCEEQDLASMEWTCTMTLTAAGLRP
jgi:hypothetical protein